MSEVERLRNEYDDLRTSAERWERAWQRVVAERDDLRAKLATARDALELYANKRNWGRSQFGRLDIYKADTNGPYVAFTSLAAIDAPQLPEGEAGPITERERKCAWKRTGPLGYYMGPIYQWVAGCCNRSENDKPRHDWCPWCGGRIRIEESEV